MFLSEIEKFKQINHYPAFFPKAVFFDMDGVLFDSMKSHATAWVQTMRFFGFDFSENEAYMNEGRTGASTIDEMFLKVHNRNSTDDEKQQIYKKKSEIFETLGKVRPMPFAYDILQKIKAQKIDIYVVTGSGERTLLNNLEHNFPGIFHKDKMVTAYDVEFCKPHPEPYLQALKKSKLNPWEVVVIENAPLGVESSKSAGLFTIAVNTGPLNDMILLESGANLILQSMEDLTNQWERFCEAWN